MSGEPIDLLDALQRSVEKAISSRHDQRTTTMKKTDVSKAPDPDAHTRSPYRQGETDHE